MQVTFRSALPSDSGRIARLLIDVRLLMPYAPSVHADDEIRAWVSTSLVPSGGVVLALANDKCVGVMATARQPECSWITQMAVDPDHIGLGIGSALIAYAFRVLPQPIRLFTFQANAGARRFYERHGFRPIRLSDGQANEERCPDVLYEFVAPGNARAP